MRPIVLGLCLFAAACSSQKLNSPTSPTSTGVGLAQTEAQGGTELPFRGSFTELPMFRLLLPAGLSRERRPNSVGLRERSQLR